MPEDDRIELVASVGALDGAVAALREFVHRSGALRAVGLVDRDPGEGPAVVECGRLAVIEVDFGDRIVHLPHGIELDVPTPALPDVRQLPPFDVDPATGEVTGTSAASITWSPASAASPTRSAGATSRWRSSRRRAPRRRWRSPRAPAAASRA